MLIALDYDGTYDADPEFWDRFINSCYPEHDVILATYRHPEKDWTELMDHLVVDMDVPVYCTNGVAKDFYLRHFHGIFVDWWIDDNPKAILENSSATHEWLAEWRKNNEVA